MIDCNLISHLVEMAGQAFNHNLYRDIEAALQAHGLVYDGEQNAWIKRPSFIVTFGECRDFYGEIE